MSDTRTVQTELGADAARILRAYRQHATELPSAAMDQRILAMAAAAAPASAAQSTRTQRRPLQWLRYAASVAVVVVGAGLTWRMVEEGPAPGRSLQRPVLEESASDLPSAKPVESAQEVTADADHSSELRTAQRESAADSTTAEVGLAEPVPAPTSAPAAAPQAVARTLQAPAPQDSARARHAPVGAATASSAPRMAPAAPPISSETATSVSKRAAVSPLDPQVWLDSVRALRDSGHVEEAIVSLREWRLRYPQRPLPEDLQALLDGASAADAPR